MRRSLTASSWILTKIVDFIKRISSVDEEIF